MNRDTHLIDTPYGTYKAPARINKLLSNTKWNDKGEPDGRYFLTKLFTTWLDAELKRLKALCSKGYNQPKALDDIDRLTLAAALMEHRVREQRRIDMGQRR